MSGGAPAIGALSLPMIDGPAAAGGADAAGGASKVASGFGEVLRSKLDSLNESQQAGKQAANDLATGRVDDMAQTMLRVEQANVSLQLATQVRNKAVEAYQEILRMQV